MTSMGDLKNSLELLRREIRKLSKRPQDRPIPAINFQELLRGSSQEYLKLFKHLFCDYSIQFTGYIVHLGFELTGQSDRKFIESLYLFLRDVVDRKPPISSAQFFTTPGFTERKAQLAILICSSVRTIDKQIHQGSSHRTKSQSKKPPKLKLRSSDQLESIDVGEALQKLKDDSRSPSPNKRKMHSPIKRSCLVEKPDLNYEEYTVEATVVKESSQFESLAMGNQPLYSVPSYEAATVHRENPIVPVFVQKEAMKLRKELQVFDTPQSDVSVEQLEQVLKSVELLSGRLDQALARITVLETRVEFVEETLSREGKEYEKQPSLSPGRRALLSAATNNQSENRSLDQQMFAKNMANTSESEISDDHFVDRKLGNQFLRQLEANEADGHLDTDVDLDIQQVVDESENVIDHSQFRKLNLEASIENDKENHKSAFSREEELLHLERMKQQGQRIQSLISATKELLSPRQA